MNRIIALIKFIYNCCYKYRVFIYSIIFVVFVYKFSHKDFVDLVRLMLPYLPAQVKDQFFQWLITGLTSIPLLDLLRKLAKKIREWQDKDIEK